MQGLLSGRRFLIVEDDEGICALFVRFFSRYGAQSDVAGDGRAALDRIQHEHYDLIICDLRMPGMDGQHFYEALLQDWPELSQRVLFITGDSLSEDAADFLDASGCLFLIKPFSLMLLLDSVKAALGFPPEREVS